MASKNQEFKKVKGRNKMKDYMFDFINGKIRIVASVTIILMVIISTGVLLAVTGAGSSFAFVVEGEDCGLTVEASPDFVDVSNLNPGDVKTSYLDVSNEGENDFDYFFDIEILDRIEGEYRGEIGETLDKALIMTIEREDENQQENDTEFLFSGSISEFEELDMGSLSQGDTERVLVTVDFPGLTSGNEYQGSEVTAQFKFRAECDTPPDDDTATLQVRKFYDEDEDGIRDDDDQELEWTVYVEDEDGSVEEYTTPVTINDLEPGTYEVWEEVPNDWRASTDTEFEVTLTEGDHETIWFGNYETGSPNPPRRASLTVQKFNDLDGDGERDAGEPWIEDWVVFINGEEYTTPVDLRRLAPGEYHIVEEEREGWEATTDTEVTVDLRRGDSKSVNFGNQEVPPEPPPPEEGSLRIQKFHDLDGDGSWDENEPEIVDWTVYVDGEEYTTPVTLELEPGEYTVSEEVVDGWIATTPIEVDITIEEGEDETVLFGNQEEIDVPDEDIPEDVPDIPEEPEEPKEPDDDPKEPEEDIIVPEEDTPEDVPEMPQTGEESSYEYYIAGTMLVIFGAIMWRRYG